jgi:hypothetical protein
VLYHVLVPYLSVASICMSSSNVPATIRSLHKTNARNRARPSSIASTIHHSTSRSQHPSLRHHQIPTSHCHDGCNIMLSLSLSLSLFCLYNVRRTLSHQPHRCQRYYANLSLSLSLSLSLRDTHCRVACFAILQMLVVVEADIVTQLSRSS